MSLWREVKEHEHGNYCLFKSSCVQRIRPVCPFFVGWRIRSSWLYYNFPFKTWSFLLCDSFYPPFKYFFTNVHYYCWNFKIENYQNFTSWELISPNSIFLLHYANIHKTKDRILKPFKIHSFSHKINTVCQKFTLCFLIADALATGLSKKLSNLLQQTRKIRNSTYIFIWEEHIFECIVFLKLFKNYYNQIIFDDENTIIAKYNLAIIAYHHNNFLGEKEGAIPIPRTRIIVPQEVWKSVK